MIRNTRAASKKRSVRARQPRRLPLARARRKPNFIVGRELVFALVGPVGIDFDPIYRALKDALSIVDFTCEEIRLSNLLHDVTRWSHLATITEEDKRIREHMAAGTAFRETAERDDALAVYAIGVIREHREDETGNPDVPRDRHAYVLRSLKRPEEVDTLRRIYGRRLFVIAATSPRESLVNSLATKIAASHHSAKANEYLSSANQLIQTDEKEQDKPRGQNLRDTFPKADLFISVRPNTLYKASIARFVEAIFGYPFHTPHREELGMYHAQASALRSADLGRQVGAAITTLDGDVVSVGTNEVPKAGGGLYWDGDQPDQRDFKTGRDSSVQLRQQVLGDVLDRLQHAKWFKKPYSDKPISELILSALAVKNAPLKGSQLMAGIEFMRAVHAEMAAIINAARRGISVDKCVMYSTTFPCHDCAKHLVAAGISKVFYIEPYAKSLATHLYPDSVAVDPVVLRNDVVNFVPFFGIAPRQYIDLFTMPTAETEGYGRKDESTGVITEWNSGPPSPSLPPRCLQYSYSFYVALEQAEATDLRNFLIHKGITFERRN